MSAHLTASTISDIRYPSLAQPGKLGDIPLRNR
jgi:hypothetical protein